MGRELLPPGNRPAHHPLGTGYAVWTGIGAVGASILGIVLFNEPRDALRLAGIGMIVGGIVLLKLNSGEG
jgi:quaternary ammonium compound-resistance protein SugE